MRIISLLTDFGLEDNFVGVMKAVILNINPKASIVDICHNLNAHNIKAAAFILEASYRYFPKNTIHLAVVDPGVGSSRKKILVKTADFIFVGPDNGVLSLALQNQKIEKILEITNTKYFLRPVCDTFQARDIFAGVAAYLSIGERIESFGKKITTIKSLNLPKFKINRNNLIGEVIYIDRFGNLITNIDKKAFTGFVANNRFEIKINNKIIKSLSRSYADVKRGELLAIFDSFGNLEVSVNRGSAKDCLGAKETAAVITKRL